MLEMDRRNFLKLGLSAAVGLGTGVFLPVALIASVEGAEKLSGHPVGNAGIRAIIEDECENAPDKEKCIRDYKYPDSERISATIIAPLIEEGAFRAFPSFILSETEGEDNSDGLIRGGLSMTRREIAFGVISSLLFGATHNFTRKGFDTNVIPAPQITAGFVFWYLQRKFGFVSNTIAHSATNFIASQ